MKNEKTNSILKKSLVSIFFILLVATTQLQAASLEISDQTVTSAASTIEYTILVSAAPNEVKAFGFDIIYDTTILDYIDQKKGVLISEFDFFAANEVENGTIRIGGFATSEKKIDAEAGGILMTLSFKVLQCKNSLLQLAELKDDIKTWQVKNGQFECQSEPTTIDNCPNDPDKTEPGSCGCGVPDIDTDNDGTYDCNDDCPNDPAKTTPGTCGCGVTDSDTDGDGTKDCFDNCPDDPTKIEPGICGCGVTEAQD